ncbi:MAG: hypothetical protein ACK5IJ_10110 [Mangrovibacterium sp.]
MKFSTLILLMLVVNSASAFGQSVSKCDSTFIYNHLLSFKKDTNTFNDIDEPEIYEFYFSDSIKARKYFYEAAFLKSIPIDQRVIMVSYLEYDKKLNVHKWMYSNLENRKDTINYFRILDSDYGMPYSKIGIAESTIESYLKTSKK